MTKLSEIRGFLDNEFTPESFESDKVINGLNVENSGNVNKIAVAVDSGIECFYEAKKAKADLLLVHHGPFLNDEKHMLEGSFYKKIKVLIDNDIALYALHLPLDTNAKFSHNRVMMENMSWEPAGTFADYKGTKVGLYTEFDEALNMENIIQRLTETIGKPDAVWGFGDYLIRRPGIISGDGLKFIEQAKEMNIDLLITGEQSHSIYWKAYEAGMNCIFMGHYTTEKAGLVKLGKYIAENFNLEYTFIDLPTGL